MKTVILLVAVILFFHVLGMSQKWYPPDTIKQKYRNFKHGDWYLCDSDTLKHWHRARVGLKTGTMQYKTRWYRRRFSLSH